MNNILNSEQIKDLKTCGKYLAQALSAVGKMVKPGVSTADLDAKAEELLLQNNCKPAFKNYYVAGAGNYPATLCVSINDEIVHGLPSKNKVLKTGDLVSLDIGAEYNGIFTDMAVTLPVGEVDKNASKLLADTKEALTLGIKQAKAGNSIGDIGAAVESVSEERGWGLIRDYVGHGIGTKPHLPPQVPNWGEPGRGEKIVEGMALAIEPMFTSGGEETVVSKDGWAVKTADQSLAAHFEHTIIIENGKPVIVTVE